MDGKVIDSSLSRDPLFVELGKKTVIPGNYKLCCPYIMCMNPVCGLRVVTLTSDFASSNVS